MEAFIVKYKSRGEILADFLERFSLDIVGIIVQYAHEWTWIQQFSIPSMENKLGCMVVSPSKDIFISSQEHLRRYNGQGKMLNEIKIHDDNEYCFGGLTCHPNQNSIC